MDCKLIFLFDRWHEKQADVNDLLTKTSRALFKSTADVQFTKQGTVLTFDRHDLLMKLWVLNCRSQ